jgi:hypothetical protein
VANVNNPHGLRPLMRTQAGGAPQTEPFPKQSTYAYAIFKWDPVTELAGYLNGPANGITPGTTRYLGVSMNWSKASVAADHLIMVDPGAIFEAQEDNSGGSNVVAAKMGYNANLTTTAGGSVTRDNSAVQVSGTSINTTSSLDVKLQGIWGGQSLGVALAVDNAFGAYARLELRFNKHLRNAEVTQT